MIFSLMSYFKSFIPVIICFIIGCKPPSDRFADEFKKVNDSLERSNEKMDSLTRDMKYVGFDEAPGIKHIFDKTFFYLKRLKNELDSADNKGERLDVAEKLIIETSEGDSLYKYVMEMYGLGIRYGDISLQRDYRSVKEPTKEKWLEKYFKETPTIAARTILSKFQNDLVQIETATISAGIQELKNKMLSDQ